MKKALSVICALMMCFTVASCGKTESNNNTVATSVTTSNEQNTTTTVTEIESAYEQLNDYEKELYGYLKDFSMDLVSPNDMRVIKAGEITHSTIYVQLSMSNAAGGKVSEVYEIYTEKVIESIEIGKLYSVTLSSVAEIALNSSTFPYDVSKINHALQEYWNEMGL